MAQTNTNTVTNGGTINVGVTEIITNPVTSPMSVAITNNGSLQFWQTSALTVSGAISGTGTVTKASGSGNLTLSGANTFSGTVTVSSGTLTATGVSDSGTSGLGQGPQVVLGSGTTFGVTVSSGTNSTTRALIANGGFTLANSGNGSLVWNGNVTNNATSASEIRFNSTGTGTNVFAGVIGNTTNNSSVNLNFQASQIWSLTGSNTFGGGITIGGGKVIADKLANSGTASSIGTNNVVRLGYFNNAPSVFEYVGSGSTNNMQLKLGASAGTGNNAGSFLHNGSGVLLLTNATFTLSSDVQAANMSRVLVLGGTNAADNTIAGVIANADTTNANSTVSIVKDGTGKWVLSGNSTYTGGTTISNGILQIGAGGATGSVLGAITNNGTLILSRSGNPTISNDIRGTGAVIISNGTVTLSGASTFGGKVTVAGSSILYAAGVADSGTSALGTNNQVELGSGANLQVNVGAGTTNTTTRALIANGSFTLGNGSNGVVVWNGNVTNNATSAATMRFNSAGTGTNVFAGVIGNTTNNSLVGLDFQSTQIWSLTGSNTFGSGITIGGGKVIADKLANSGTASSIGTNNVVRLGYFSNAPSVFEYVGAGSTNNMQLRLGAAAGTGNNAGSFLHNGSGVLLLTNATFTLMSDVRAANMSRVLVLGGTNAADNTIAGVIANADDTTNANSTVSVVKDGTGKWVLGGTNTYTGGTTVSNGVLELRQTGSLRFVIKGSGTNNQINGTGTLSLKGKFDFDLTGAATNVGSSWTVVASNLSTTYDPGFSVTGFTGSGGQWSRTTNGVTYVFDQASGVLSVKLPVTWSVSGPLNFGYSGSPQFPAITPTGSTGTVTYSFTGIDGTSYSDTNGPTAPGRYKVTATVASDNTYATGSQDVYFTIGNFSAFRDFWWNGLVTTNTNITVSPNNLADWLDSSKAAAQGRNLGTPTKTNAWSYGMVNCTGGATNDPYPTSITGASGGLKRNSWEQFWDATLNTNATYANAPPLWIYRRDGVEIGWFGSAWYSDAPGANGVGAGRNGLSTNLNSNTRYLWLRVGGTTNDGVAPAVRWTAPADGTYRFSGEFLPGGNTNAASSTMAVAILTGNNPNLVDTEAPTLLPRTVMTNDGAHLAFNIVTNVVAGQTVTWLVGSDGSSAGDVMGLQAEVTQVLPLTLSGVTASNKVYDGTNSVTLSGTPSLTGVAANHTVGLTSLTAAFDSATAGTGKAVSISVALTGADASYYALNDGTTLYADILPKGLTITGASATNRAYDGTTNVVVGGGNLVGVVGSDDVTLDGTPAGTVVSPAVGTNKVVAVDGYALAGAAAGNYSLTQPTLSVNITAKDITGSFTVANKTFDGTDSATVTARSLSGVVGGDVVTLTGGTANFANANIGTSKTVTLIGATLSGADAGNYALASVDTTTADILAAGVTFAGTFPGLNPGDIGADGLRHLTRYFYGATNTNAPVALPVVSLQGGNIVLTAVIRTNDSNLSWEGQVSTVLAGGTGWIALTNNPQGTPSANTNGIPDGCQRREFSVPQGSDPRKFLRLKITQP